MKRVIGGIVLGIFLLLVLALAMLPGIVRRYTEKHSPELVGRQLEIEKLRVNLFTGTVRVVDFTLYEANERDPFVSFDTLLVRIKPLRLLRDEFIMRRFYLGGLQATVIHYDSTFNFTDLIEYHTGGEKHDSVPEDTLKGRNLKYHLSDIEMSDACFIYENRTVGDTVILEHLAFYLPYFGWNQEERCEAGLRFTLNEEGTFETAVKIDPAGGAFDARLAVQNLYLDGFSKYLAEFTGIQSVSGIFNTSVEIRGKLSEAERSVVSGNLEVRDLCLKDGQDLAFLKAGSILTNLREVDPFNARFLVDSVALVDPYIYFELKDSTNNFTELFRTRTDEPDSTGMKETKPDTLQKEPAKNLYYAINSFRIENGTIDYRDHITDEAFDYHLSDLEISSDSITAGSDRLTIFASMLLNERGKLLAEAAFNPLQMGDIVLDFSITDFHLSDLNIYSSYFTGFPVLYGDMVYRGHTELVNQELKSDNRLVLNHVELGEKSGGLQDIPLKFALFILKDRNGVIDLDIPVRGSIADPTVDVWDLVWNTLKNLIIKVAAAPYDFLAAAIGVDPEKLQAITYNYLDTLLTEERQNQLDLLMELENAKEGLEIKLVYYNDLEKESGHIAVAEAGKQYRNETGKDYQRDGAGFENYLRLKTGIDSLDVVEVSRSLILKETLDSLALEISRSRLQGIEHYLKASGDPTQIETVGYNPKSPANVGSLPRFEVKYSMSEQ